MTSPTSLLVAVDTEQDEITRTVPLDGCGYLLHSRVTARGDLLLGTDVFSTAVEIASDGERAGPSCVVRLDGADLSAEPERLALATTADSERPFGSFLFVDDASAFVRVLDSRAAAGSESTVELNGGANWRWGFLPDLEDGEVEVVAGSELGTGFVEVIELPGGLHAVENSADFAGSTLVRVDPDGTLHRGVHTAQTIVNVMQLASP